MVELETANEVNRREAKRAKPTRDGRSVIIYVHSDEALPGLIVDVSSKGIGVLVENSDQFNVSTPVNLIYKAERLVGTVMSVTQAEGELWRIGVQWDEPLEA